MRPHHTFLLLPLLVTMEEFIDKNGVMYPIKDESGKIRCFQQWPQVSVAHKLCHELTRLEAEFGMTPSARTRIHIEKPLVSDFSEKASYFMARQ